MITAILDDGREMCLDAERTGAWKIESPSQNDDKMTL